MNEKAEKEGRKKEVGSLCSDECVPGALWVVGRCWDAEQKLKSCQQPYVMKLYPCHSKGARGIAAHWLPPVSEIWRSLMDNMNGPCSASHCCLLME